MAAGRFSRSWRGQLLDPWLEDRLPFAFQYIALAFAAWYRRLRPADPGADRSALLGTRYFILVPRGSFAIETGQQIWSIVRYLIDGFAISLAGLRPQRHSAALRLPCGRARRYSPAGGVQPRCRSGFTPTIALVYLNPEATRVFGVGDPAQLLGRPVDEHHPSRGTRPGDCERRNMMRGTSQRAPLTVMKFLRADGKPVLLEVKASPIEYRRPGLDRGGRPRRH